MKNVYLLVSNLQTDRDVEVLHYEVQAGPVLVIGDTVRLKAEEPGTVRIAVVPDGAVVALLTPDVRLALSVEDQPRS